MGKQTRGIAAGVLAMVLVTAACGDDGDVGVTADTTAAAEGVTTTTGGISDPAACAADVALETPGTLAIGVEILGFDPDTLPGVVALAVAEELGIDAEFTEIGLTNSVSSGAKPFDIGVAPWGINPEREEAVDFSDPFYTFEYVLVAPPGSPVVAAESIADLKDERVTTTRFFETTGIPSYIDDVITPTTPVPIIQEGVPRLDNDEADALIYTSEAALKLARTAGLQPVAILPTDGGYVEEMGLSFEEGSELVPCVNQALAALEADGTLDELREEWVGELDALPTLRE